MKTVTFDQLPYSEHRSVFERVAAMLESMARFNGRVCLNESRSVAAKATYRIMRSGRVWQIFLPTNLQFANHGRQ